MKLVVFLIVGVQLSVCSQIRMNGLVVDEKQSVPIQFANVFLLDYGVGIATNVDGAFELVLPKKIIDTDSLSISCMGYQTQKITIAAFKTNSVIKLSKKRIELDELVVYNNSYSVNDIMRVAIGKIRKNYQSNPYQLHTFYRHYCSEDDVYGRLIEAAVTIYDPKGHKNLFKTPESKVEIDVSEIRKSFDYTKNFDEHDAISIYSTIKYDVSSYETLLHSYPDNWNFTLIDTTFYNNSYVWVLGYEYDFIKNKGADVFKVKANGKIFISISDFAIVRVEEKQENVFNKEFENHSYLLEWEVNYQKYLGNYYLSYVKESGWNIDEKLDNNKKNVSKKDHKFHVEIMVNAIVLDGFEKFKGKEPDAETINSLEYKSDFWESYGILKHSPLNEQIIQDLEKEKSLREQYQD